VSLASSIHRRSLSLLRQGLTATLVFMCCSACTVPPSPTTIEIGITATANEPAPNLTGEAERLLWAAVDAGEAHATIYQAQDNSPATLMEEDITVRRGGPHGELESNHGLKKKGFETSLGRIRDTLAAADNKSGKLDLFNLLADMGRRPGKAKLIIASNGLQTVGELDLTRHGLDFDVAKALAALPANSLPDLTDKHVLFTGSWAGRRSPKVPARSYAPQRGRTMAWSLPQVSRREL